MRVGEFALAAAQPGEVEAQRGDAVHRQPLGDALGRQDVLAAGEAVREQREGGRLAQRQVERGGELFALGVGKFEALGAHGDTFLLSFRAARKAREPGIHSPQPGLSIPGSPLRGARGMTICYSAPAMCFLRIRRTTSQITSTATGTNSALASVSSIGTPRSCRPFIR